MDPAIWSHLPEDVLDRVVALLPLPTIINLRPTCKRFHSLLLSPSFLSLHHSTSTTTSSSSSSSFLILSHPQFSHKFLSLYSAATATWHTTPLPPSYATTLLSSSSGLLLFSLSHSHSLLLFNPLTASSRFIPSPAAAAAAAGATATATLISLPSHHPHGYQISLLDSSSNQIHLYSSLSNSWTHFPIAADVFVGGVVGGGGVHFGGSLYFTTLDPSSILRFDLATGNWGSAAAPDLRGDQFAFVRLLGGRGGEPLFLVGGVGPNGISRSLRVWEMVAERGWEERGVAPEGMCRKFMSVCYYNYAHVYCLWHEGMVCVCCTTWPEVLYFKVGRGVWHWLPRCPFLQNKWSCGFRWFSFVPDLFALV